MTKKRFVQARHWCIDRVQKRETEYWETAIEWLNELNEECGRLNILLNAKDKTIQNLIEMGTEVEKENEELKHQLSQQEMEYATDCNRLAEENNRLKLEIRKLKNQK